MLWGQSEPWCWVNRLHWDAGDRVQAPQVHTVESDRQTSPLKQSWNPWAWRGQALVLLFPLDFQLAGLLALLAIRCRGRFSYCCNPTWTLRARAGSI